jgi:DNA polymerase-1
MSCSRPNLQNQPKEKEYRECYIAGHGNVLVIADYSAQEPRVVTFLAQDERMAEIFRSGEDIYIAVARIAMGETITKDDPRRKDIKAVVLGSMYGITEYGLNRKYGILLEEGRTLLSEFFNTFTGIRTWVDAQARAKRYVTTISGRKIWLNKYSSQWERNSRNAPVQGSSADMLKMAMARFVKKWKGNPIILPVHDELVLEVSELCADDAKRMLEEAMIEVANEMHPTVPAKVEIVIGKNWGAK